jgi:hypothetical protein
MTLPGVIRGVVVGGDGGPVAGARVAFRRGPVPLPDIAAVTAGNGTFALSAPEAGTYELAAFGEAGESGLATVRVGPGESVTVTVRLGSGP